MILFQKGNLLTQTPILLRNHKGTSFVNTLWDESLIFVHYDMIHDVLILKTYKTPISQSAKQGIRGTYSIGKQESINTRYGTYN